MAHHSFTTNTATDRYLDNLKEEALKLIIKELLYGDKAIIQRQIDEFNKMFPRGL